MIHRRDVDVVHVEQDAAVGALDNFGQKLPLGHLGAGEGGVGADVFDGDGNFKKVLHHADALDGALDGLPCVGQRQQIVGVGAVDRCPSRDGR